MAIEQESTPQEADLKMLRRSAIENEIPTYRAVSTRAIFAVICGALAALSFTHEAFYLFALTAVVLGISADRAIDRRPEMLTGRGLARAGIAMGLIFGLSIFTIMTTRDFLAKRQAAAFAVEYSKQLKNGKLTDLYWITLSPAAREHISPEENLKQMQDQKEAAAINEMKFAGLRKLVQDLHGTTGADVAFREIEALEHQDLTLVAGALFDVHVGEAKHEHQEGETPKEGEEKHEHEPAHDAHAFAVLKGVVPEG